MGNVKKIVAPIVGMTFFWAYFRYQAVFGTLYPLGSEVSVFGYGIQLYTVFLIEALVLSVIALFSSRKAADAIRWEKGSYWLRRSSEPWAQF